MYMLRRFILDFFTPPAYNYAPKRAPKPEDDFSSAITQEMSLEAIVAAEEQSRALVEAEAQATRDAETIKNWTKNQPSGKEKGYNCND